MRARLLAQLDIETLILAFLLDNAGAFIFGIFLWIAWSRFTNLKHLDEIRKHLDEIRKHLDESRKELPAIRELLARPKEPRSCRSCGAQILNSDTFCGRCGTAQDASLEK